MSLITLTTDFGTQDPYVGIMKGVILGINPQVRIVDLTHAIPPGDSRAGAFAVASAAPYFPAGTVHVVVIDPGVGSARRAIALQTRRARFVGPDNGVLSLAVAGESAAQIREITNERLRLKPLSRTFHGRDVFAPVAARLAGGMPFLQVGPPLKEMTRIPWPEPVLNGGGIRGEVIHVDHFGNLVTNIGTDLLHANPGASMQVFIRRARAGQVRVCYSDVAVGETLALIGSSGLLEISVNGSSAAA